jgi:hypothetical protein
LQKEYELELLPTIETWLADSELAALTIESATDISDRILAKSIKLVDLKLDSTDTNGLLVFKHDRKSCKIKCGLDFYVALNQVFNAVNNLPSSIECAVDLQNELARRGYHSPFLKNLQLSSTDNRSAYIVKSVINDVEIRMRKSDEFIDITAMASAYGKDLSNLLKNEETWDLFAAKAETDGVDFMSLNRETSVYTRVTEIFLNISTVTWVRRRMVAVLGCTLN